MAPLSSKPGGTQRGAFLRVMEREAAGLSADLHLAVRREFMDAHGLLEPWGIPAEVVEAHRRAMARRDDEAMQRLASEVLRGGETS